jgi:hypothetical protein
MSDMMRLPREPKQSLAQQIQTFISLGSSNKSATLSVGIPRTIGFVRHWWNLLRQPADRNSERWQMLWGDWKAILIRVATYVGKKSKERREGTSRC